MIGHHWFSGAWDVGLDALNIRVSPLLESQPKLQLRLSVPVSDEFRKEMNQWLLDRFGYVKPIAFKVGNKLFIPPSIEKQLKEYLLNARLDQQGK